MEPPFSLGPAILRTADSPVHVPDTFRDDLLHKHLDAASRAAVAQTCRAGLSWLLQDWAKDATLRLPVRATSGERAPDLLRGLQRAKQQLDQRQSSKLARPTGVLLHQQGQIPRADTTWWHIPLTALASSALAPTLTLSLQRIPAALLEYVGVAWPALTTLGLEQLRGAEGAVVKLPPAAKLPALRRLAILRVSRGAKVALVTSIGPYLPQLHVIAIEDQESHWDSAVLSHAFTQSNLSRTLHSLAVPCELNKQLCRLLQQYAPALQILKVPYVSASGAGVTVAPVCSWSTLVCTDGMRIGYEALLWLPLPAKGKLSLALVAPGGLEVRLPVEEAVSEKLKRLQFTHFERINLMAASVPVRSQAEAFRAAQPHVQHFQTGQCDVNIHNATMSAALAAELRAAAAGWRSLSFQNLQWPSTAVASRIPQVNFVQLAAPLTDAVLRDLVTCAPTGRLYVPSLQLSAQGLESIRVGWHGMIVQGHMQLSEWLHQAVPMGTDPEWTCHSLELCLSADQDSWGMAARLYDQLNDITVTHIHKLTVKAAEDTPMPKQPTMLRAALSGLSTLPCAPKELCFSGLSATSDVIREFKALRDMSWLIESEAGDAVLSLCLDTCEWARRRADSWPIAQLPKLLPRCYATWHINASNLRPRELNAFIKSAATLERTATLPLTLKVQGRSPAWAAAMTALLLKDGMSPYMSVVSHTDV